MASRLSMLWKASQESSALVLLQSYFGKRRHLYPEVAEPEDTKLTLMG